MINRLAELRRKKENGEGGFTLIELLVVVVIIGILMAIAVPLYLNYRQGANDKAAQSDVRGAISAIEQCNINGTGYPAADANNLPTDCKVQRTAETDFNYKQLNSSSYRVYSKSNNGSTNQYYCYASATGGAVKSLVKGSAPSDTCS